jgi:hypothetical protein
MAAKLGNVVSRREFGTLLAEGRGGARDTAEGRRWLQMAAGKKDEIAQQTLRIVDRVSGVVGGDGRRLPCIDLASKTYMLEAVLPTFVPQRESHEWFISQALFDVGIPYGRLYYACTHKNKNISQRARSLSRSACACIQ